MSFKRSLEEFIAVDDEIKNMARESKELRRNKQILEEPISTHMLDNGLEEQSIEISGVKVCKKKSSCNMFTKANVAQCALTLFGSEITDALIQMIEDLKETTEKKYTCRIVGSWN